MIRYHHLNQHTIGETAWTGRMAGSIPDFMSRHQGLLTFETGNHMKQQAKATIA
jgi:hypothetical protein